ncbi:alpha/beta fold hydrolase [Pseudoclavibacter soli]|uniref:alpha/beta fold hydrolase n=1 Tax=Pseudoclavibacter soli TaxID=452623 RepID=UPI00040B00D2|nr:alpha/beta fold hydrolase [Pseudoclavibacter soli]
MSRFVPRTLAATLAAAALITTPTVTAFAADEADALTTSTCTDTTIVAFRGSGEKQVDGSATETNGWEGATLNRVISGLRADGDNSNVIGVGWDDAAKAGYEAIAINATSIDFNDTASIMPRLIESANAGAASASEQLDALVAACPSTKVVALGYSQGAMAARTLAQLRPDVVTGAVVLGDPYQESGSEAEREGIVRWWSTDDSGLDDSTVSASYSHETDPISDHDWRRGITSVITDVAEHTNYATDTTEVSEIVQDIQDAAGASTEASVAPAVAGIATDKASVPIRFGSLSTTHEVSVDGATAQEFTASAGLLDLSAGDHKVTVDGTEIPVHVTAYADEHSYPNMGDSATEISATCTNGTLTADVSADDTTRAAVRLQQGVTSLVKGVYGSWQTSELASGVQIDLSGLAAGTYDLVLVTDDGRHDSFSVNVTENAAEPPVVTPTEPGETTPDLPEALDGDDDAIIDDSTPATTVDTVATTQPQTGELARTGADLDGVAAAGAAALAAAGAGFVFARRRTRA